MDGAESVSQCPINPGESFTYRSVPLHRHPDKTSMELMTLIPSIGSWHTHQVPIGTMLIMEAKDQWELMGH